jgi:hypothetical protein
MRIGTENKKQVCWMIGLLATAALILIYNLQGSDKMASPVLPGIATVAASQTRTLQEADLEAGLNLDGLALSQHISYEVGGRNPFRIQEIKIERIISSPKTTQEQDKQQTPELPQLPPIPLQYYGFAKKRNESNRIFLQGNGEVFIAKLDDIVERRYKVIEISKNTVVVEDVLGNNQQSIQLAVK